MNEESLKAKILEAQKNTDIAALYVLEKDVHDILSEENIGGFYANILDIALERLTDTLESHTKMDMKEVQDFATTRALYEYAMEHYSAGDIKDASALFEVLSGMTNDDKFSSAMKLHWLASAENISLDDFMSNIADMQTTQTNASFYISGFQEEAQKLLNDAQIKGE